MNYDEVRKIKVSESQRKLIVSLTKSIQDQFDHIPKSFFQINTILDGITPQLSILYKTLNSDFIKQAIEVSKKQMEAFEVVKNLYVKPFEYGISNNVIPISTTNPKDFEIADLKKQIQERDRQIILMKSKIEKDETFGLEILKNGVLRHKGNLLKTTTDSNAGAFLKESIENKNHFVSDKFCEEKLSCQSSREITFIIRDLNRYLKKDGLTAKYIRNRNSKGYTLCQITEKITFDHN